MIKDIEKEVRNYFAGSRGSHDWEHTERVMKLAIHIGKKEKADLMVLKIAAILHDIGRQAQDQANGKICHAEEGARLAEKILVSYPLSDQAKSNILHCIVSHRFRNEHKPETLEAKILYDADKLDSIGAVGIGRAFLFAGEIGAKLHDKNIIPEDTQAYTVEDTAYREFLVKLSKIKNRMLTAEGKKMAVKRHQFMVAFFDQLNREVDGLI